MHVHAIAGCQHWREHANVLVLWSACFLLLCLEHPNLLHDAERPHPPTALSRFRIVLFFLADAVVYGDW